MHLERAWSRNKFSNLPGCLYAQTRGGGNCANALTAAARLGLDAYLVSKVGADSIGNEIEEELLSDGVQTKFLLKAEGYPSPFTYIIVDKQGNSHLQPPCLHPVGGYTIKTFAKTPHV